MKKKLFFLSTISILLLFSSCQGQTGTQKLTVENFETKLKSVSEKTVLDVRTQDEYNNGHLANATLVDYYQDDFKSKIAKLDKNKPVFVYCAAGGRSNSALKILTELGFKEIYDLKGGFNAWADAKKPIVK